MKFQFPILAAVLVAASAAMGQTSAPSTGPAAFEEHEWVVLVCSPFQTAANQDGMVLSTLPANADSRRQSAPDDQQDDPQPIGVIRLVGQSSTPVDVSLGFPSGRAMAAWPKAKMKSNRLLWANLNLSADLPAAGSMEGQTQPDALDATSWLNGLRHDASAWLRSDDSLERFLAYDLELNYSSPLKITAGKPFSYGVSNPSSVPLREVHLYQPDGSGWRQAEIAQLGGPGSVLTTQPAAAPGTAAAATTQQSAELATEKSPATQPSDLFSPWKTRLMSEGLSDGDTDLIVRLLAKQALDPKRLTAVYELDGSEIDRLLPLEILPEPAKTVRVGLVILRDADPGVASEIDDLVGQLGDDDWAKRDAAYQALAKLGKAAKPQLERAQSSRDMEVVWRAERLLAAINPQAPGDQ